jgi:two-component system, response regulator PdtaR
MGTLATPNAKQTPTILVVEDEPLLRSLITDVLESDGRFNVIAAGTADEAMGILCRNDGIACVFTDVRMPGRLDGIALANHILQDY